jgi:glucose/arabinose dehydrogenase
MSLHPILAAIAATCAALGGDTKTRTATRPDLTNQGSPRASTYRKGQSYTQLATPPAVIALEPVARDLTAPMMVTEPGDGSGRLFIVDQIGLVRVLDPGGEPLTDPFLDLRSRLVALNPHYDERGLLSLAFHPRFAENGRFFVFYSAPLRPGGPRGWNCTNHLSEFRVAEDNPDRADPGSERILLAIDKPAHNHNGGPVLFGPDDGYLYLALGDGGGADDQGTGHTPGSGNAQDLTTFLGKIIRIDVDRPGENGKAYAIPADNPFATATGVLPEIYAYGLRNPAYLSFDAGPGHRLITASAGQALFESVYVVAKGGNYGWRIREGTHCFDPADHNRPPAGPCPTAGARGEPLIGPVVEIGHDMGTVIVGGFVYRGSAVPALSGAYLFGDWSGGDDDSGRLLVAMPPSGFDLNAYPLEADQVTAEQNRMWTTREVRVASGDGRVNAYVRGFGQDLAREVYVMLNRTMGPDPSTATGEVVKVVPARPPLSDSGR